MALSTLRLRESQVLQPGIRQYAEKTARPRPQDIQEVVTLSKNLRKLTINENPEFIPCKPVLPGIRSDKKVRAGSNEEGVQFTDCGGVSEDINPELDNICCSVSEGEICKFLQKSQIMLNVLHQWWWEDLNSLEFLNWWFTKLSYEQRVDWFKMECSILLEEVSATIETRVSSQKVMEFLLKILHEHPHQFCKESEVNRLPDMLETLVSSDKGKYCEMLSDVKCRTSKPETLLALRTYSVISVCYAAVSFYRKLATEGVHSADKRPMSRAKTGVFSRDAARPGSSRGRPGSTMGRPMSAMSQDSRPTTAQNKERVEQHNICRAFDAVSNGFVSVLQYLFECGYVDAQVTDNQGRSLVFVATLHKQHGVLNFLLSKEVTPSCDVNRVADNGNTPLHVAASAGNPLALNILLKGGADPHLFNPECNGATPLHLAVLNDNVDCVILLLGAGSDPMSRMGCPADTSAIELAKQMDHDDVLKLLIGAVPVRSDSALYLEGEKMG